MGLRESASHLLTLLTPRYRIIPRLLKARLTYLDGKALKFLVDSVRAVEREEVPGVLVEAGCALGGSTIAIASARVADRALYVYDTFGMIPPPSSYDGGDVYRYRQNLLQEVLTNLQRFGFEGTNIQLVPGTYKDSMNIDEPVAFAHVDCNWHDSVWTALERISRNLSAGGRIVVDDYYVWSGCKAAVDQFPRGRP